MPDREPLILTIGQAHYLMTHVKGDWWLLEKPDGTAYQVGSDALCGPSCTCPDYRYRREGNEQGGCKHIKSLTELGIIPSLTLEAPKP